MARTASTQASTTRRRSGGSAGFALVTTISLLVLMGVVVTGLLSLSVVVQRNSLRGRAMEEARSNARLALLMALGEMQETLGGDRFITAPAGILDEPGESPRHYTGVWKARGNPRDKDSADALGAAPDYDSSQAFVRWLVSNPEQDGPGREGFFDQDGLEDPVAVVGAGTAGDDTAGHVVAGRVRVAGEGGRRGGRYAWWVGENATKALVRLSDESMRAGQDRAQALLAAATPGPYGVEAVEELGLQANTGQSDRLVSLRQVELLESDGAPGVPPDTLRSRYHDLTSDAVSLLTNVTAGGMRKDLSLFFEGEPAEGDWEGSVKGGDAPIGAYGLDALSPHNEYDTGSWKVLRQHYALHKASKRDESSLLTGSMGETLKAVDDFNPPGGNAHPYPSWNRQRKLLTPVLVRLAYVLSIGVQDASLGKVPIERLREISAVTKPYDKDVNKYIVTFHAYPVAAMWNPYNLPLDCPGFSVGNMGMSVEHTVTIGGRSLDYQWIDHNYKNDAAQWNVIGMTVDRAFTLAPGEVKMFFGTSELHRHMSQFYAHGAVARSLGDIEFDASERGREFSAGIVKNGVIGNTFNQGDNLFPGHELIQGLFASEQDVISIDTRIFTPQGSRNAGPRADYDGLLYYGTYSSLDVRMISRSFGRGDGWKTTALWWTQWGGGSNRHLASKWSNKIGWRNDLGNPVVLNGPIRAMANVLDLKNGREQPYMVVDLRLKATESDPDQRNPNITWLHNIPGHGYVGCTGEGTPGVGTRDAGNIVTASHARPYTMVYAPVQSAGEAWNFLQLDAVERELRPFMGNSFWPGGQHRVVAMEIPLVPLQSIAQLQHVQQVPIDATRWSGLSLQNYAIGNSFANPNVPGDQIRRQGWNVWLDTRLDNADSRTGMEADLDGRKWHTTVNGGGPPSEHFKPSPHLDRSYVANTLLWDDFYFTGLSETVGDLYFRLGGGKRKLDEAVEGFFGGEIELPNARLRPNLRGRDRETLVEECSEPGGYRKAAAYIDVAGGFNVNSVSKTAWKAFLASNLKKKQVTLDERGRPRSEMEESTLDEYIISRHSLASGEGHRGGTDSSEDWLGYRVIDGDDLDDLAEQIVREVRERGPFRSLAEFVNRRLEEGGSEASLRGALQAALDRSSVNSELDADRITKGEIAGTDYAFEEAALLSRHAGTPAYVMQGDLLQSVGPLLQVRSDTFTVRAYGESADGSARSWCEATVQRDGSWLDPADPPEEETDDLEPENRQFGRRLRVVSFRWLGADEV